MYDGGSLQNAKAGTDVQLVIDTDKVRIVRGKEELAVIPATAITEISYGQDVHRRVGAAIGLAVVSLGLGALMLLAKSKKLLHRTDLGGRRQEGRLRHAVR